jgi:hypothetical protein
MKRTLSLAAPTPVIAAALRRRPVVRSGTVAEGGKGPPPIKKIENNYVASKRVRVGHNSGNRPGARAGNRNALRTGEHTAAARADRERWRQLFGELDVALDAVVAAHRANVDPSAALLRVDAVVHEACAR